MPQICSCPKGHRWETSGAGGVAALVGPHVCPVCGAAGETVRLSDDSALTTGPVAPAPLPWDHATLPPREEGTEPAARSAAGAPLPVPKLEGYEFKGELGRGGMGVVYKALQIKLNRLVAFKMMVSGAYASSDERLRFQVEAEAVARIQHPNVVQIFDVGEHDGHPFCAFEFVDGGNLDDKLAGKPLTPEEAARLTETLARAIHFAHQRDIVHRDLKPANVLLTADGTPKITDFGLAKRMDSAVGQTQSGAIMGTPSYMSPEQAAGRTKQIGPPTDIYALGAMLYEFLTGRPPFLADTGWDTIVQVVSNEPAPPSQLRPRLPHDLETICLKCLEKEPKRRYASAGALADDLRRFLDNEPILARPTGRVGRSIRWAKRRPAAALLTGLLAFLCILAGAAGLWHWQTETERRLNAERNKPYELDRPPGLPPFNIPSDDVLTLPKIDLGRQLFFDPRLSVDDTVSCATCHDPARGWSNGKRFSTGVEGKVSYRNIPTVVNSAYLHFLFWDGRANSLEEQSLEPIHNPKEMALPLSSLVEKLNGIPGYQKQFQRVFGTDATSANVAQALASFERTVLSGDAPYDRYQSGDKSAMTAAAVRGMNVFFNAGHCSACHSGPNFSDGVFHNIGVGMDAKEPDLGRLLVKGNRKSLAGNRGSFKTPTLREIARTAPYMHDGSLQTLEEVVDFYAKGGIKENNPELDEEIFPLKLTPEQKQDLITFLKEGLSSPNYPLVTPPELPK